MVSKKGFKRDKDIYEERAKEKSGRQREKQRQREPR